MSKRCTLPRKQWETTAEFEQETNVIKSGFGKKPLCSQRREMLTRKQLEGGEARENITGI